MGLGWLPGCRDPLKLAGIGPFQVTGWVNDQSTSFGRHPRYGEFRPNEPYFDTFNQIVVPDTSSTQAAFLSGQTQMLAVAAPDDIQTVRRVKAGANLYTTVDQNWQHIRPSVEYAPFKDFRVRKALFLAGDYKEMADSYYGDGWAYQAALNPMYPEAWGPDKVKALPGYNPDTKAADRAEAAKLLEAAGFPNGKGLDFEIIVVDDGSDDDTKDRAAGAGARVVRHPYNKGNGAAVKTGIRTAAGDWILIIDADGQHAPQDGRPHGIRGAGAGRARPPARRTAAARPLRRSCGLRTDQRRRRAHRAPLPLSGDVPPGLDHRGRCPSGRRGAMARWLPRPRMRST